jgi:hypothetical protein
MIQMPQGTGLKHKNAEIQLNNRALQVRGFARNTVGVFDNQETLHKTRSDLDSLKESFLAFNWVLEKLSGF